tara:strand:- start:1238 stop:2164 length:927 start_codon:yes stop_codon:yes gene_type:complete
MPNIDRTPDDRMRSSEERIDRRRADLESQIEIMLRRPYATSDPEVNVAILEARQVLLELEIEHRRIVSVELIAERSKGSSVARRVALEQQKRLMKEAGAKRSMTVGEALGERRGEWNIENRARHEDPVHDPIDDPIDSDPAEIEPVEHEAPVSASGSTIGVMARAGKRGAQVAAASAANKELVALVKSLSGDHWPSFFDSDVGRCIAELVVPSALLQLVNAYPGRIPQSDLVVKGCELAVEAVSRDAIEPLLHMLVPLTKKLAQAGSSAMSAEMSRVRPSGMLGLDEEEAEHIVREAVKETVEAQELR